MMAVSPPSASTEVVIVGGGPAGASAARLLSTWGHSVVLLAREPRRPPLGESLPPSVRKLFGLLEIQGDIDLGGFYPTTGNTVWWGEGEVRSESFAGGPRGTRSSGVISIVFCLGWPRRRAPTCVGVPTSARSRA